MKFFQFIVLSWLLLQSSFGFAQPLYVTAKSGLILREQPDLKAQRITTLAYATQVFYLDATGIELSIVDEGEQITGEWIRIATSAAEGKEIYGYVFDGYLTTEPLSKPLKFDFGAVTLELEETYIYYDGPHEIKSDTVYLEMDLEGNFFKTPFKIEQKGFDTVSVYQQFNRSVTIYNEGPHCDMVDWKNFKSDWIKVSFDPTKNNNRTLDHSYTEDTSISFVKEEIDQAIQKHCSEEWYELVKDLWDPKMYPMGVATHQILFKIVLSNAERTLEKLVLIDVPMGC